MVLVPEAEFAVRRWREELDPAAAIGVPAHVTLMYPFESPAAIDEAVMDEVTSALSGSQAFTYTLESVQWFGDAVVWLAPTPAGPFIDVTRVLLRVFPEFPRYGGAHGDSVVPHLTVGDGGPGARMAEAARDVAEKLPIEATADEVALIVGSDAPNSWRVEHRFKLARPSPAPPGA